jgi:hypothetical protein
MIFLSFFFLYLPFLIHFMLRSSPLNCLNREVYHGMDAFLILKVYNFQDFEVEPSCIRSSRLVSVRTHLRNIYGKSSCREFRLFCGTENSRNSVPNHSAEEKNAGILYSET